MVTTVLPSSRVRDDFLIVASDGVWDVLSNDDAVAVVQQVLLDQQRARAVADHRADALTSRPADADSAVVLDGGARRAVRSSVASVCAEALVDEAYVRGSGDNLTAMVVVFGTGTVHSK